MKKRYNKLQREQFISNGMIHLGFRAEKAEDIISSYSMPGCEMVDGGFAAYMERSVEVIPGGLPVVLEISGCEFGAEERKRITDALWNYYHVRLSSLRAQNARLLIRMIWFTVCFALSSLLLLPANVKVNSLLVQMAYLPFWFFGCRLFTFAFLNFVPGIRAARRIAQMAAMKVVFSGMNPSNRVDDADVKAYRAEVRKNLLDIRASDYRHVLRDYLLDKDGTFALSCRAADREAVVPSRGIRGYEMPADGLMDYLNEFLPFVPSKGKVRLYLYTPPCGEEERQLIRKTMRTGYGFQCQAARDEENRDLLRILIFTLCTAVMAVVLYLVPDRVSVTMNELILVAFWFFADYLMELILMGHSPFVRRRRRLERMEQAEIVFRDL